MPKTGLAKRAELSRKYDALSKTLEDKNAELAKLNESLKKKMNAPQLEARRVIGIDIFLTDEEKTTVLDVQNVALMESAENEDARARCVAANEAVPATELKVRALLAGIGYVDCPPESCAEIPGSIIPGLVYRHPACIAARDAAENAGAALAAHRAATERAREQLEADLKALEARKIKMLSF